MVPLTVEQIAYKEKTLAQLLTNLPLLEEKSNHETRPEVKASLEKQIDDIQVHIERLQQELAAGLAGEPVADELCQRIAQALVKGKFYMARKYITKLESIEPFYPNLDRLKAEAEAERAGRRTTSIAQGSALPYGATMYPPATATTSAAGVVQPVLPRRVAGLPEEGERRRFSKFFQFHVIASCLVVLLIICVMLGVGGMSLLQWLVEGG
jgi:hypothetical protein